MNTNVNLTTTLDAGRHFVSLGISVLPIQNSAKSPVVAWKQYQERLATDKELVEWFGSSKDDSKVNGLGIVCGSVSGGLLAIDFDDPAFFAPFKQALEFQAPELSAKLRKATVVTTRKGYHLMVRCSGTTPQNQVLTQALLAIPTECSLTVKPGSTTVVVNGKQYPVITVNGENRAVMAVIETRGEGGYVVAPPTDPYKVVRGAYSDLPVMSDDDIDTLFSIARSLTEVPFSTVKAKEVRAVAGILTQPGDAYNESGDCLAVLLAHGWSDVSKTDASDPGKVFLCRPGKSGAVSVSATYGGGGTRLFYVFSSNAHPFSAGTAYTPFQVRAFLEFDGDFAACAAALRREGYGSDNMISSAAASTVTIKVGSRTLAAVPEPEVYGEAWETPLPLAQNALPGFPTEAFPPLLRDFSAAAAHSIQVPTDLIAALVLGVTSTLMSKVAVVKIKETYFEHLNVFVAAILPPASRKSPAFSLCMKPLVQVETRIQQEESDAVRQYEQRHAILVARRDETLKRLHKGDDPEIQMQLAEVEREIGGLKPVTRTTLWADDITPEALAALMGDNGGRMSILSAEGGVFDIIAGRYSSRPNLEVYLKGHAHDALRVQRKGNGTGATNLTIEDPSLTMCVTVQPTVLSSLQSKQLLTGRGLMARYLYFFPADIAGHRQIDTPDVPAPLLAAYHSYVRKLADYQPEINEHGESDPHLILMDSEARRMRNDFDLEIERRYAAGGDLSAIREWAGKLVGATVRVAGLLHVMTHVASDATPWAYPLTGATMADAIKIGRYAIEHARAAHAEMRADANVAGAVKVLDWIKNKGLTEFSPRTVLRGLNAYKSNADLVGPLQVLVDHACIRRVTNTRGEIYEVNPGILHGLQEKPQAPVAPILTDDYNRYAVPPCMVREEIGIAIKEAERGHFTQTTFGMSNRETMDFDCNLDSSDWDLPAPTPTEKLMGASRKPIATDF